MELVSKTKGRFRKSQIITLKDLESLEGKKPSSTEVDDIDYDEICSRFNLKKSASESSLYITLPNRVTQDRSFTNPKSRQSSKKKISKLAIKERPGHYPCNLCEKKFSFKSSLDRHIQQHMIYTCSGCGKRYGYQAKLKSHQLYCLKKATSEESEPNHEESTAVTDVDDRIVELNARRSHNCDQCDKSFSTKKSLQRHTRIRHRDSPLPVKCTKCDKRFLNNYILKVHMITHSKRKDFKCDVCKTAFKQNGNLIAHMRIHTGEKPFGCEHCGKRFHQSGTRNNHVRRHLNKKT